MSISYIIEDGPGQGTPKDDSIVHYNTPEGRVTLGLDGHDNIRGADSGDALYGNRGRDTLHGFGGSDSLYGGKDDDDLWGYRRSDFLYGNLGSDYLNGGEDNDFLFGGRDNDDLFGHDGDDFLSGDRGFDVLTGDLGDSGNDTFVLDAQDDGSYDYITDFEQGRDRIQLGAGLSFGSLEFSTIEQFGLSAEALGNTFDFSLMRPDFYDDEIVVSLRGTRTILGILSEFESDLTPTSLTAADFISG